MIEYVEIKYGRDCVGQILALQSYGAKASIRAVGRAFGCVDLADTIARMIPDIGGVTIKEAMDINDDLRLIYNNDDIARELIDTAMSIESLPSDASTHPAGVIIAPHPLMGNVPMWQNRSKTSKKDQAVVSQADMKAIEELGYLKMDFLGLKALSIIAHAIKMIEENHGVKIDYMKLLEGKYDCPEAYAVIASGQTEGIFQLEGQGMTSAAMQMQVSNFKEVTALVALYRPGPMAFIPDYIKNKANPSNIKVPFQELSSILEETYGILVYQEQVTEMVMAIAHYDMSEADNVRRAIGKKIDAEIVAQGKIFSEKGSDRYPKEKLQEYWDTVIRPFGEYAFNKSHAACYARIAAMMGFLKAFWPVEFMAASFDGLYDKSMTPIKRRTLQNKYIRFCTMKGIPVLKPCINTGDVGFSATKSGEIQFGMSYIKDVGTASEILCEDRKANGAFLSGEDFLSRAAALNGVSRGAVAALIKSGACDSLGTTRTSLIAAFDGYFDKKKRVPIAILEEARHDAILRAEKATCGLYFSGHPLDPYATQMIQSNSVSFYEIEKVQDDEGDQLDEDVTVIKRDLSRYHDRRYEGIALITNIKEVTTKKDQKLMGFVDLDDKTGTASMTLFPKTYAEEKSKLKVGDIVRVRGRLNYRDGEVSIVPDFIKKEEVKEKRTHYIVECGFQDMLRLKELCKLYPGIYPLSARIGNIEIALPQNNWISKVGLGQIGLEFKIFEH